MSTLEQAIVVEKKVRIGGVEYLIKPPTLSDWSYFINWYKEERKKDLISTYKLAGEKIDIKAISEVMVNFQEAMSVAFQFEGSVVLIHRLISKNKTNPKISVEELKDSLTREDMEVIGSIVMESLPKDEEVKNLEPQVEKTNP